MNLAWPAEGNILSRSMAMHVRRCTRGAVHRTCNGRGTMRSSETRSEYVFFMQACEGHIARTTIQCGPMKYSKSPMV